MRRYFVILASVLILPSCTHYSRLTSEDFEQGGAPTVQFARDNYECQTNAVIKENEAGGGDLRGVYNRIYAKCMTKRGYGTNNIELLGIGG